MKLDESHLGGPGAKMAAAELEDVFDPEDCSVERVDDVVVKDLRCPHRVGLETVHEENCIGVIISLW